MVEKQSNNNKLTVEECPLVSCRTFRSVPSGFICLVCAVAIMVFIFYNSAQPAGASSAQSGRFLHLLRDVLGLPVTSFIVRKLAHFSEFAALGFFMCGSFGHDVKLWRMQSMVVVLSAWMYAASDEVHQLFVEGRACEFRDWCIDAAGVVAGVLLMAAIKKLK